MAKLRKGRLIALGIVIIIVAIAAYVAFSWSGARAAVGEKKTVDTDAWTIVYYDSGSGVPVVLLPSLGRPASDFNEVAQLLNAAGYRTVAIEFPGIGGSAGFGILAKPSLHDYAKIVSAVVGAVGGAETGGVHVIGHAFGNRVARAFASDYGPLTKSVTLLAAGGYTEIPKDLKRSILFCSLQFLPDSFRERQLRAAFFAPGNPIPDYWLGGWYFTAGLPESRAALNTPLSEWAGGGTAPILLLQGDSDAVAPQENADKMKEEFGDRVTVVTIPGAGHAMLPEQPEKIAEAVVTFLKNVK
jgi:pimeloyl-ACP methyl ester carboxylesterase